MRLEDGKGKDEEMFVRSHLRTEENRPEKPGKETSTAFGATHRHILPPDSESSATGRGSEAREGPAPNKRGYERELVTAALWKKKVLIVSNALLKGAGSRSKIGIRQVRHEQERLSV